MSDPAFTLRIRLYRREHDARLVTITAYDDLVPGWDSAGRVRLTCEVKHGRAVVFPKGQLTCALHAASDGIKAKGLVMSLVAMRPGDTDADYFADYTPDQLAWVTEHGEALSMERETRYCDENGNVREPRPRRQFDTLHAVATAAALRRKSRAS
jgi:hypothetical protein